VIILYEAIAGVEICKHRASSTRTMVSHLMRYLTSHAHFSVSDKCRDAIYRFIAGKERNEPVSQADIFTVDSINNLLAMPASTMTQIRDRIIFAFGICTLARASELSSLTVGDVSFADDGILVNIHRKKACASRSNQKIWVCSSFFGWDLLGNLKKYLSFIPPEGPLWRAIPPNPKRNVY